MMAAKVHNFTFVRYQREVQKAFLYRLPVASSQRRLGVWIPTHNHPYNGQIDFVAWEASEVSKFGNF